MVTTTDNMREFVFYTSNVEGVKRKFHQLRATVITHELQIIIQIDTDWSIFKSYTK